jgi:hypothetical protein
VNPSGIVHLGSRLAFNSSSDAKSVAGLIVELYKAYCEVIAKRWETLTGKKRVVIHGHQPVAR